MALLFSLLILFTHYTFSNGQKCARGNLHGSCLMRKYEECPSGANWYATGLSQACPTSPSGLSCCLPINPIIIDIAKIYSTAASYKDTVGFLSSRSANQLVMEWLRHRDYYGVNWVTLSNFIDELWIAYAYLQNTVYPTSFADPLYDGINQHPTHMAATMNAVYVHGESAWQSDLGGWAGDLYESYADWRLNLGTKYPADDVDSGYRFCIDKLASKTSGSRFLMRDLEEDCDGFNIAHILRATSPEPRLDDTARDYFSLPGGAATSVKRFKLFTDVRFNGKAVNARDECKRLLTSNNNLIVSIGRLLVIPVWANIDKMPADIDPTQLRRFCDGFSDVLFGLTTNPNRTTVTPVPATSNSPAPETTAKSGWTVAIPDSIYYENDISSDLDSANLYLVINGAKTVNTKCIGGADFNVAADPITVKKGSDYTFETEILPNPDSCCQEYYSNADCTESPGQFEKRCHSVQESFPIDVASWKVYNCTGIWTGEPQ